MGHKHTTLICSQIHLSTTINKSAVIKITMCKHLLWHMLTVCTKMYLQWYMFFSGNIELVMELNTMKPPAIVIVFTYHYISCQHFKRLIDFHLWHYNYACIHKELCNIINEKLCFVKDLTTVGYLHSHKEKYCLHYLIYKIMNLVLFFYHLSAEVCQIHVWWWLLNQEITMKMTSVSYMAWHHVFTECHHSKA